ncbi:antibiotic biosynthesis monooxygenase [Rathayibacter oskolensis]|uniref:antibiotic biosynthesis monooxygenase n=1 Tax=Rathayibacter oskolensis TaxID=1891671 RepID=UPI0026601F84|nr:antibiotic biosynthesis monooxygenase [Rathayibacter oskolensis]WKK72363.1 antibiotic biosynthesis monooxygenase [Rathayibacter oskolensis]
MAETTTSAPVSLVVHRRLAEADYARYEAWQDEVGARLEGRDGFLGRESIRPDPPHQVDWIVIERFRDRDAARSWMQSPERAALLARIDGLFVGNDAVHLVTEEAKHPAEAASVLITTRVAPEDEGLSSPGSAASRRRSRTSRASPGTASSVRSPVCRRTGSWC